MVMKLKKHGSKFNRILVTSAWPYIHGMPHLGNLTGSILPADVYARFCRLKGYKTIYVTGSDSHGTPIEVAAFKLGIEPKELAYENHAKIKKLFDKFDILFDNYSITDSETNKKTVYDFFEKLLKNGYISEKEIEMAFCKNCKRFLPDRWIEGVCPYCNGLGRGDQCNDCGRMLEPKQLIDPYCIVCKKKDIEFKNSKHLFLDLPKSKEELTAYVKKHKEWPENAKKQSLSFLKDIQPRCITRDIKWGFQVPLPWYEDKIIYVWFDAVLGYISAVKEFCEKNKENWEDWWKNKKTKVVQFLAKDNIIFHTLIFPGMLIGVKDKYILPDYVASCEFLITKGVKFSKSEGVGITIEDIFDFRPADYWRYTLMALYPERGDSEFNLEELQRRVNTELADTYGNFIHRTLVFIKNNFNSTVPKPGKFDNTDKKIIKKAEKTIKRVEKYFEKVKFREVLDEILSLGIAANVYLNKKEPWHNSKTAKTTLYISANISAILSVLLEPFIPSSCKKIRKYLNFKIKDFDEIKKFIIKAGHKITEPRPLFKKIDDEGLAKWREKFEKEVKKMVTIEDFQKLDIRIGEIKSAEDVPESDKLVKLKVDIAGQEKQIVAGLRPEYSSQDLVGKQIVVLTNLKPAKIKGIESQGMLLAALENGKPILIAPQKAVKSGSKVE